MVLEKKRLGVQPQNGIPGFILYFPLEPSYGYIGFVILMILFNQMQFHNTYVMKQ